MNLNLDGKIVLVTGGTGAIGTEILKCFVEEGARVFFTYKKADDKAQELCRILGENNCTAYKTHILDQPTISAMVKDIYDQHGKIDILVNNAAITDVLPLPLIEEEDWDECMNINTKGTFIVTKEVVRYMIKNRSGTIINMGSLAGERIMEVPVHYATSKAAMTGFTLSLTKELSRYGIRVNCVVPGLIDGGVGRNVTDKQKNQYLEFCTANRLGKAEEVASLVVFLSSSKSAYINGQLIHIDGGI